MKTCPLCGKTINSFTSHTIYDEYFGKAVSVCSVCANRYYEYGIEAFVANPAAKNLQVEHQKKVEQHEKQVEAEKELDTLAKNMVATTSSTLENYTIQSYLGVVSTSIVLGTGFLSELSASISDVIGSRGHLFEDKLSQAKSLALDKLKLKSATMGANAIIGVSFDIEITNINMFIVSCDGTAVIVNSPI